jgi:hypothetical protein
MTSISSKDSDRSAVYEDADPNDGSESSGLYEGEDTAPDAGSEASASSVVEYEGDAKQAPDMMKFTRDLCLCTFLRSGEGKVCGNVRGDCKTKGHTKVARDRGAQADVGVYETVVLKRSQGIHGRHSTFMTSKD